MKKLNLKKVTIKKMNVQSGLKAGRMKATKSCWTLCPINP